MYEVKLWNQEMARDVWSDIRPLDLAECRAMHFTRPDQFGARTEKYIGLYAGKPFVVFGINAHGRTTQVWLWGNNLLNRHAISVTKICRRAFMPRWTKQYWPRQMQIIGSEKNGPWIESLGFEPTRKRVRGLRLYTHKAEPLNTRDLEEVAQCVDLQPLD